jgi:uncharacterized membrane protein YgdD (TMEM256/DUF423 family)
MKDKNVNSQRLIRFTLIAGALFALLSVCIGAFAAHGLKNTLDVYQLGIIETGARYQMYHGLALILSALCAANFQYFSLSLISTCFCAGVIFFSGSLYAIALLDLAAIGFITPIGGVLFLLAWSAFIYQSYRTLVAPSIYEHGMGHHNDQ